MSNTNVMDLIIRAEQGDVAAQANLGVCYYKGDGIEQNYEEAVKWLSLVSKPYEELCSLGKDYDANGEAYDEMYDELVPELNDRSWATYWLGECYLHGNGVEKNISRAIELWEFAVEDCDGVSMELAGLYSNGIEMPPNYQKAAYWWQRASHMDYNPNTGFPEARYELAVCFYEGRGVEKDIDKALEYFKLAIDEAACGSEIEIKANAYIRKIENEVK